MILCTFVDMKHLTKVSILVLGILLMSGSVFRFGTPFETGLFHQHYFENGANSRAGDLNTHIHFNLSDTDPHPGTDNGGSVIAIASTMPGMKTDMMPEPPAFAIYHPPKDQII
jgi:hypothetical protein